MMVNCMKIMIKKTTRNYKYQQQGKHNNNNNTTAYYNYDK